jgi:hypothetical protein
MKTASDSSKGQGLFDEGKGGGTYGQYRTLGEQCRCQIQRRRRHQHERSSASARKVSFPRQDEEGGRRTASTRNSEKLEGPVPAREVREKAKSRLGRSFFKEERLMAMTEALSIE